MLSACGQEIAPAVLLRATMAATGKPPRLRESPRLLRPPSRTADMPPGRLDGRFLATPVAAGRDCRTQPGPEAEMATGLLYLGDSQSGFDIASRA